MNFGHHTSETGNPSISQKTMAVRKRGCTRSVPWSPMFGQTFTG